MPAEPLGRPGEPSAGHPRAIISERQRVLGKIDGDAEATKPFQLKASFRAQRRVSVDSSGKKYVDRLVRKRRRRELVSPKEQRQVDRPKFAYPSAPFSTAPNALGGKILVSDARKHAPPVRRQFALENEFRLVGERAGRRPDRRTVVEIEYDQGRRSIGEAQVGRAKTLRQRGPWRPRSTKKGARPVTGMRGRI